jgi:toxin HigB-1
MNSVLPNSDSMIIRNVRHRGLRLFIETDNGAFLPQSAISKLRSILSFLQAMDDEKELYSVEAWKAHQLAGDRKGSWALHVTRNWRLTFRIDRESVEIIDLDYEDYH